MGIIDGNESARLIFLREDYKIQTPRLPVEEYASDVVTKRKSSKRDKSWMLSHDLMKRCYNIPGIPNGSLALMVTARDVEFDPFNTIDTKIIKKKMGEIAKEQQHKAESAENHGTMARATVWLSVAAFVLFLMIGIVALLKYYNGS